MTSFDELTDIQAHVLAFIIARIEGTRLPPTRREICDKFGWASTNAAQTHLLALERKGYVESDRLSARALYATEKGLRAVRHLVGPLG